MSLDELITNDKLQMNYWTDLLTCAPCNSHSISINEIHQLQPYVILVKCVVIIGKIQQEISSIQHHLQRSHFDYILIFIISISKQSHKLNDSVRSAWLVLGISVKIVGRHWVLWKTFQMCPINVHWILWNLLDIYKFLSRLLLFRYY